MEIRRMIAAVSVAALLFLFTPSAAFASSQTTPVAAISALTLAAEPILD